MCFDDDSHPPIPLSDGSTARGEDVTLTAADGTRVAAYLATPGEAARAQVVILPDVRGLHEFYRELALRFADVGVRALAIDYFGRTAPDTDRSGDFDYGPHVQQMTSATFRQDLVAAIEYLKTGEGADLPTFTIGFCMGGSLSFWAGSQGLELSGVVGFYASLVRQMGAVMPAAQYAGNIDTPVLGLFGGADQHITQDHVAGFKGELEAAGTEHEIVVYPGAPHGFFDRRAVEFAAASAGAWARIQGFIAGHGRVRV